MESVIANRYKIIKKLGEGGMGAVFFVKDNLQNDKEMALKVMSKSVSDSNDPFYLKFKQEFWAMKKLQHPNLVEVYDYGISEDKKPYLTMEIVEGKELTELKNLSYEQIYDILIQLCRALGFIHSRLMVHCDIKPENIRIKPDGTLKLMDFGLMNQLGMRSDGKITGTVTYLPPEVPRGGIINESSDLYSTGVLTYELIIGAPPFIGKTILDVVKAHLNTPVPQLTKIKKDVPPQLENIVMKLMAKEQHNRYSKAEEVIEDIAKLSGKKVIQQSLEQKKSYLNTSVLVGRKEELKELEDSLNKVIHGEKLSLYVAAPAGVGKSRLIQEFKLIVQLNEIPFCQGKCFEQGMYSYQPMVEALKNLIPLSNNEEIEKFGPVLIKLFPELKEKGIKFALPAIDANAEKLRLFETVIKWLESISSRTPIVIFIDDLHWSDMASVEMLNTCNREIKTGRVMFLCSFRDDEVPINSPIWQTVEENLTKLIKLKTFNQEQIKEMIIAMLGKVNLSKEFLDYIYKSTSGNAFFVTEVMRYIVEENLILFDKGVWILPSDFEDWNLPTSIEGTITTRLKKLSPSSLKLIQGSSVAGHKLNLKLFMILSGEEEGKIFNSIEELIERQFLNKKGEEYFFPHDRVRETLYSQINEEKKKELHQKVGEVLEEENKNNIDAVITELAYHFSRGLDKTKAMKYLIKAGEMSSVRMEASILMKQGVDILEELDYPNKEKLLLETWDKLAWISYMISPKICLEVCEKIIPNLEKQKVHIDRIMDFQGIRISSYTMIGRNDKAVEIAENLLKFLNTDSVAYGLVIFGLLNERLTTGKFRKLVKEMEMVSSILEKTIDENTPRHRVWIYGFSNFIREDALAWLGEKVGNNKYSGTLEHIGKTFNFLDLQFWNYYPEVVRNSLIGNYKGIKEKYDEIFNMIKRMGRPIQHENRFNICYVFSMIENGFLEEASRMTDKIVTLGQNMGNLHQQANGRILQGMIAVENQEIEKAIEFFQQAIDLATKNKNDQLIPAMYRLASVYLQNNEIEKASPLIQQTHSLVISGDFENPYHQIHTYRLLGWLYILKSDYKEAEKYLKQSLRVAQKIENDIQIGFTYEKLGLLYHKKGQNNLAKKVLNQAIPHFEKYDNKYQVKKIKSQIELILDDSPIGMVPVKESDDYVVGLKPTQVKSSRVGKTKAEEIGYRLLDLLEAIGLTSKGSFGEVAQEKILETNRKLEQVEKINEFSRMIMQSLNLREILNNIIDYVIQITQADRGFLILLDEKGELFSQVVRTKDGKEVSEEELKNFSTSFINEVLATGESLWVEDAQSDSRFSTSTSIMSLDLRTIICVPIKVSDEIIGLIYVDRNAITKTFNADDLSLVESLSSFAGLSLINAKLHNQAQERNDRLQMLNELSKVVSSTFVLNDLLKMVIQFCLKITKAETGYSILLDDKLSYELIIDKKGELAPDAKMSQSVIQKVIHTKKSLCSMDTGQDEELGQQASIMALELKSVMCVPILGKEKLLGVIYVSSNAINQTFTQKDLSLMEAIVSQVGLAIENAKLLEIQKKQEEIEHELKVAHNIQTSMLPEHDPEVELIEVTGYSRSAAEVGGDYYDYFKISDTKLGLAVGDVNGHGVSASLLMAMAKSCLFVQGRHDPNVIPVMEALNSMIFGGTKERLFMTFIYSIFDLDNLTVTLSSAGHHLPYYFSKEKGELVPIDLKPVYPLGVREKVKFKEITLELKPGDILVYYTDGIIEAPSPQGEEFSFERFEEIIVKNHYLSVQELKNLILNKYEEWVQGGKQHDDITLVIVKVKEELTLDQAMELGKEKKKKLMTGFLPLIGR